MIPLRDEGRDPVFPIVVYALVAINVAVFLHEASFARSAAREAFINAYALIPYDITHGVQLAPPAPPTPLTLVTSQFFHGSVLHIFFNMLFLLVFGPEIEFVFGHLRFAAFYLACGVLGGIAEVSVTAGSHVPGIGASGAIAGVLGGYLLLYPRARVLTLVVIILFFTVIELPAVVMLGVWFVEQAVFAATSLTDPAGGNGTVAYFAHVGGFACGVLIIRLLVTRQKAVPPRRPLNTAI